MDATSRRPPAALVLFLLFTAISLSYFLTHKPFEVRSALAIGGSIFLCALAAAITAIAGGLGRRLLNGAGLPPLTRLSIQAGLGLGMLGIFWLAAGLLGAITPLTGWIGFGIGLLGLRRSIRAWLHDWKSLGDAWHNAGRFGRLLGGYTLAVLGITLPAALAPPIAFDALTYHLTLPRMYVLAGRFTYVPEIMFWGMPQTGEMLYTWAMLLGGERLPAVLGWAVGGLALVGMLGLAQRSLNPDAGFLAPAALVSGYTLAAALPRAYVDWLAILFGVAWLAAIEHWAAKKERGWLLLAGVLAGMALGTKYTAGILLVCGSVVILWRLRWEIRPASAALGAYLASGVLTVAPWLIKNWVYTGSPIYPLIFPAGAMTPMRLALYSGGRPYGGWLDVIILPLRATFLGVEEAMGYSASIGPILFGLAFCAPLAWSKLSDRGRVGFAAAAAASIAAVLVWMTAGRFSQYLLQSRLYFTFFPALALLAGAGWFGLQGETISGVRLGRLTSALVVLILALNLLELVLVFTGRGSSRVVLGIDTAQKYTDNNLGWYSRAVMAVRDLPVGSKTLMLWEPRSYACQPNCAPDEVIDRWLQARYEGATTGRPEAEILANWRAAGFTHLLVHLSGVEFIRGSGDPAYTEDDWKTLDRLLARLAVVQDFDQAYRLYSLR